MSEYQISLQIEDYNYIFSDFDPRSYNQKALSDDFLSEIKRASVDKDRNGIELKFLVNKKNRDINTENIIKKRLKAHFKRHAELTKKEKNKIILQGLLFSMVGVVFMFATTLLIFKYDHGSLMITFFIVMLEPAGWFSFWEGLNTMFFESKRVNPELTFYKKMSKSDILFESKL